MFTCENKIYIKKIFIGFLILLSFLTSTIFVYATYDTSATIYIDSKSGGSIVASICNVANNSVSGTKILNYDGKDGILSFDNITYQDLSYEDKKEFMGTALSATTKARLSAQTKNRVYHFIEEQDSTVTASLKYLSTDLNADYVSARAWFKPFGSVIGVIMGVICLMIFVSLGLSISIDLAYISLPMVKLALDREDNSRRPLFVSNEAWHAMQDAEKDGSRMVLSIYMKKRVVMILVLAVALGYLVSGRIYELIIYIMDAFNIG